MDRVKRSHKNKISQGGWVSEACATQAQGPEFEPWHPHKKLDSLVHTYNPSEGTWTQEPSGLRRISQPKLESSTCSEPVFKNTVKSDIPKANL